MRCISGFQRCFRDLANHRRLQFLIKRHASTGHRVCIHELGGSEVLSYEEFSVPEVKHGELLVKSDFAGVNFIDTYFRTGLYKASLPITLGKEGAGTIIAVGKGVEGFKEGDRVCYCMVDGAYATHVAVPAAKAVTLPRHFPTEVGAAMMLQSLTAHYLVTDSYKVRDGDRVVVHAGAGGMGQILVRLCARLGAHVIATVSSQEKAKIATEAGAHDVINYTEKDFAAETMKLAPEGVQVVYDGVGASTFEKSLSVLAVRGTLASYGNASGPPPPLNVLDLARGSHFVTRPTLAHFIRTPEELQVRMVDVFAFLMDGTIVPSVGGVFKLEDAAKAHDALEGRKSVGKLLLDTRS